MPGDVFLFEFQCGLMLNVSEARRSLGHTQTVDIYSQSCIDSILYVCVSLFSKLCPSDALRTWGRPAHG